MFCRLSDGETSYHFSAALAHGSGGGDLINGEGIVTRIVDRRRLGSSCNIWSQAALVVSFRHSVFGFLISIVDADRSALVRNGSNANTCSNPASPSGVTTTTVSRC